MGGDGVNNEHDPVQAGRARAEHQTDTAADHGDELADTVARVRHDEGEPAEGSESTAG